MRSTLALAAGLLSLRAGVAADLTWPDASDDLEEIMFQLQGSRARLFSDTISPCSNEASGPGRQNAAEWLRSAFHDMAPANHYFGTGGLDASLQYELASSDNTGPGHGTTLQFMGKYISRRTSLSDLIAAGVYASVRSCGGPAVPVKTGRIDATKGADPGGVPQPQNDVSIFVNQFDRMGFTNVEMIQVTACGHTLGGVHKSEFPLLVPDAPANGEVGFDTTVAAFDNKVVTEYLSNTTQNPLVVGPSTSPSIKQNSDFKVFNQDKNVTMKTLADPSTFSNVCKTVLQKMIDVVPAGVTLSAAPLTPYTVKPVNMQLTLQNGGTNLLLTGLIRVRTTTIPSASISSVTITYKDRNGGNNCGTCAITATLQGQATGFDDSFDFFPISATIDATKGISSFIVKVNLNGGGSQTFNNNGNSYPISDAITMQTPQSCLLQGSGALTVTAAVRNDRAAMPANLFVSYLQPRAGLVTPALNNATVSMTKFNCGSAYTLFSASYSIPGGQSHTARLDVSSGSGTDTITDEFNAANELAGTCGTFTGGSVCGASTSSSSTLSSSSSTTSSSSASATPTGPVQPATVGTWKWYGCQTEATGMRALSTKTYSSDDMTLESCAAFCVGSAFFGVEYARECYCGDSFNPGSLATPASECSFPCKGSPLSQLCGAGNRLSAYAANGVSQSSSSSSSSSLTSSTSTRTSTSTTSTSSSSTTASTTLGIVPVVGNYGFVGCWTEGSGVRALSAKNTAADSMTLQACAAFCADYEYWGTEYGRECYCGSSPHSTSNSAPIADCSFTCAGNHLQYCGAGNRLELYKKLGGSSTSSTSTSTSRSSTSSSTRTSSSTPTASSSSSTRISISTTMTSSAASATTLAHRPTVSPYSLVGCWTEATGGRALTGPSFASNQMTLESCATFCSGHKFFGTEYASECYCGDSLAATSASAPLSECSMPCSGASSTQYCGGPGRLELYNTTAATPPSAPTQPSKVGAWSFSSCQTEATKGRALAAKTYAADNMTLQSCTAFCAGYAYAGVEYARECYCGNAFADGSSAVSVLECNMKCAGDKTTLCGAGGRLSVYKAPA